MKPQLPMDWEEETRPGRRSPTEERKRSDTPLPPPPLPVPLTDPSRPEVGPIPSER